MVQNYRKDFGNSGEDMAEEFLIKNNFKIIERNYRFGRYGEIDIIARRDKLIIFVEVKSRSSSQYGGALYSITNKKKRNLKFTAGQFVNFHKEYNSKDYTFRFDMISIADNRVEWVEDIFR